MPINSAYFFCKRSVHWIQAKYNINIPEDEKTFLAGVHKAICNLFLLPDSPITREQYNNSYDWLIENGYSPLIYDNGGGE